MKRTLVSFLFLFLGAICLAQSNNDFKLQNYHPVSPAAFEFLKYTELPVSEYTGIPNISIPLYTIEEDGLSIPISLSYHAGGIRVSQEASWVGLGWDMTFGSITQEINDKDDYGELTVQVRPDWNESPIPSLYYQKYYNVPCMLLDANWNQTDPIYPALPKYSYRIYSSYPVSVSTTIGGMVSHAYYIPINGNRDDQPVATDMVENPNYDSEADIFSANFLGHSIKFMKKFGTSEIVVLNHVGYKVQRQNNGYSITTPDGATYTFELSNSTESYVSGPSGFSNPEISSKIWYLTKIKTKYNKEIVFNYSNTDVADNYPSYSERYVYNLGEVTSTFAFASTVSGLPLGSQITGLFKSYSYARENRYYLSAIIFPQGRADFQLSDRDDILLGKKLDKVEVKSLTKTIKSYQLNYSYFDASTVGGNKYLPTNSVNYGNTENLRLKLLSVTDNIGQQHVFSYDPIQLPSKNSFAQDFWGFYNGVLSNTSIVPNPARLNVSQLGTIISLPDNGCNNSAKLEYTRACTLNEVKYPTGGTVSLEYELNQFDNYWIPDFQSTTNQISSGNGLRIKIITFKALASHNSKTTFYEYDGGKSLTPLQIGRLLNYSKLEFATDPAGTSTQVAYSLCELNAKGFYSSNSLSSGSGIGYSKVIRKETDGTGNTLGYTETIYHNVPDNLSASAGANSYINASLPPTKKISQSNASSEYSNSDIPENGSVDSIQIFSSSNQILRKVKKAYKTIVTPIYYNSRLIGHNPTYYGNGCPNMPTGWTSLPNTLVCYYPIYDIETLPTSDTTYEYDESNNRMVTVTNYDYDAYNQLNYKKAETSDGGAVETLFDHAWEYNLRSGDASLWMANRLTEVTGTITRKHNPPPNYYINTEQAYYTKNYTTVTDPNPAVDPLLRTRIVPSKITINEQPGPNQKISEILYTKYDNASANLQEFIDKGMTNSLLWDYRDDYVSCEAKNAAFNLIAATSFESDGKGSWDFLSDAIVSNSTAPTGSKVYDFSYGSQTSLHNSQALTTGKNYFVSYWSNNGAKTVSNSSSVITGRTYNGWTHYLHKLTNLSAATISISGSGLIDEVRLYPANALLTTYTYEPLVGITSICDPNNHITYYEYDEAFRLKLIRDQDYNIIKKYDYKYQIGFSPNWVRTNAFRCAASNVVEFEEKDMNTESSSYGQTRWVAGTNGETCNPNWQPTGQYECEKCTQNNEFNTGNKLKQEINNNPYSQNPPNGTIRWVVDQSAPINCIAAAWVKINAGYCETTREGVNTGFFIYEERDINPCSETYNQIRTTREEKIDKCPVSCEFCVNEGQKCLGDQCEQGVQIYTHMFLDEMERWVCVYHYEFSDGSWSENYITFSDTPCMKTDEY
jgi:hypothetical protein